MELPRGVQSQAFPLNINRGENIILSYCRVSEHSKYSLPPSYLAWLMWPWSKGVASISPHRNSAAPKKLMWLMALVIRVNYKDKDWFDQTVWLSTGSQVFCSMFSSFHCNRCIGTKGLPDSWPAFSALVCLGCFNCDDGGDGPVKRCGETDPVRGSVLHFDCSTRLHESGPSTNHSRANQEFSKWFWEFPLLIQNS